MHLANITATRWKEMLRETPLAWNNTTIWAFFFWFAILFQMRL
jgi:hypothetical protein